MSSTKRFDTGDVTRAHKIKEMDTQRRQRLASDAASLLKLTTTTAIGTVARPGGGTGGARDRSGRVTAARGVLPTAATEPRAMDARRLARGRRARARGGRQPRVGRDFSWATLEPEPGRFDTAWLDEVLDLLHGAGIAVDLATPSASPPPWLAHRHPETSAVDVHGA